MPLTPEVISELGNYSRLDQLRSSSFFSVYGGQVESLLGSAEITVCKSAIPRLSGFTRIVQWNIEKGKRLDSVLKVLQENQAFRWADVILLNEADRGMNRSGNRHVAQEIAGRLGMHMVFGPAHVELTKGTDEELSLEGENSESLQGNAVLSRYPVLESRVVPLPVCFEPYEFHEKRYGRRNCVWACLRIGLKTAWFGSAHLEVRNTPRCRAVQMRYLLANFPGSDGEGCVLGGDMNSNGFPRGTRMRVLRSVCRLLGKNPGQVKESMIHPERGTEPLFGHVREAGWFWDGLNSNESTAWAPIGGLEEADRLPRFVADAVRNRLKSYKGFLELKLDWLFGKNIRSLSAGEAADPHTGVSSRDPGRVPTPVTGDERISDHMPVFADIAI